MISILRPGLASIAALSLLLLMSRGSLVRASASTPAASRPVQPAPRLSPFACDMLALDPAARKRHFDVLGPALRGVKRGVHELPDGYEFEFPSDARTFGMLTEWAEAERRCCPFFDIQIRMEREGGPTWLRLTGREGTKDFIKIDGAAWIQP